MLKEMKNKCCFVSNDLDSDRVMHRADEDALDVYTLPDGSSIIIKKPRFEACEVFFNPGLFKNEMSQGLGLHKMIQNSIF